MSELYVALRTSLEQVAGLYKTLHQKARTNFRYGSIEEFVLNEGTEMRLARCNPRRAKMTAKECYRNATLLATMHPKYTYVEGFAMSPSLPLALSHAWVLNSKGEVLDPTWGWRDGTVYLGVPFETEDLIERTTTSGYYGVLSNGMTIHDVVFGKDPTFNYRWRGLSSGA